MSKSLIQIAVLTALFSVCSGAVAAGMPGSPKTVLPIHAIQGTGDSSLLDGQLVQIEAIVVGDFQNADADASRNLAGFYVQEEDTDADGDSATSEGIFIFENSNFAVDVSAGDLVQVTGTVGEFAGETRLSNISNITILSSGNTLPSAAQITLVPGGAVTLSDSGAFQPDLEAFEGMRVSFTDTLSITESFQLVRFNEIKLSQGGRPEQFTQSNAPDASGLVQHLQDVGSRTITYDDGLLVQNALIGNLDGFGPTFSTATDIRMGDTIDGLSGVLTYQWAGNNASRATWRVRSTQDGENAFDKVNNRPAEPDAVDGSLKVVAFNVLNYFKTLANAGPTAIGGNPRGASNAQEFARQTEKLVTALSILDADIVALVELENDFLAGSSGNAIEHLVSELNTLVGAGTYTWLDPGAQFLGVDVISNGLIYRPAAVTVVAQDSLVFEEVSAASTIAVAEVLNPFVGVNDRVFGGQRTRPAFAATFEDLAGEQFTVAVNHFKAKSDSNLQDLAQEAQAALDGGAIGFTQVDIDNLLADPNYDQGDGQSFWNGLRTETASELAAWLSDVSPSGYASGTVADRDFLILGDLNSYAEEDPIRALEALGFTDLAQEFDPDPVSFVFSGQTGTLDYAMANASLRSQVSGTTIWNINADEHLALDYNTDFGRDVSIFDGSLPVRSSDHDPVVVGLSLTSSLVEVFSDGFEGQ